MTKYSFLQKIINTNRNVKIIKPRSDFYLPSIVLHYDSFKITLYDEYYQFEWFNLNILDDSIFKYLLCHLNPKFILMDFINEVLNTCQNMFYLSYPSHKNNPVLQMDVKYNLDEVYYDLYFIYNGGPEIFPAYHTVCTLLDEINE